ncbi:hypothetical protein ACFQU1_07650 [Chelatococcus sp. GCM10030263]
MAVFAFPAMIVAAAAKAAVINPYRLSKAGGAEVELVNSVEVRS